MHKSDCEPPGTPYEKTMTVAHLREDARPGAIQVIFLESARFHWLLRANPAHDRLLPMLREAVQTGRTLHVRWASPDSEIIEDLH